MVSRTFLSVLWAAYGAGLGLAIASIVLGGAGIGVILPYGLAPILVVMTTQTATSEKQWAAAEMPAALLFFYVWLVPFLLSYLILSRFGLLNGPATPWVMAGLVLTLIAGLIVTTLHARQARSG